MDLRKKAEELAARPYTLTVVLDLTTDGDRIYLASSPELEGCMGQGDTRENAIMDLEKARGDYIQSLLEDGLSVPAPQTYPTFTTSGVSVTFTNTGEFSNKLTIKENDPVASKYSHLVSST